jgi:putative tricarboxylic transport membrane protein
VLSILGILVGLIVLLGVEKPTDEAEPSATDINYRKLKEYELGKALSLLGLMVLYALALRPVGFLIATTVFLMAGSAVLGERRWLVMIAVSAAASVGVWYLVQEVLGIFLRPFPFFMGN